jgi:hypothetical protein
LSIKKYITFCNLNIHKKQNFAKTKKIYKKQYSFQKGLLGIIGIFLVLAVIKLLFNIPFMSLGLEEEEQVQCQSVGATPVSTVQLADNHHDENTVQGLGEIKADLNRLALHNEQISEVELNLKYQKEQQEEIKRVSGNLESGGTLYQYLVKNDISPAEILRLQEKVLSVVDISRLIAGTKFSVHCNSKGEIVQFDYQPNQLDAYHIKIPQNEMGNIVVSKDEIFREIVCFEGKIESSLYQAMIDYCHSGQLAVQLAEIFAWDIDFLTECQSGDSFKILVEKLYRGDFYRWGDILAAIYEGEMLSMHTAILFEDPDGNNNYYDEDGRCLRKAFLKAPLNYKYISSNYSKSRFHPILRIWRPHLAIDYAAPTGTPVVSIGAGTVISKYYDQGGYGNYIQIRHPNNYVTGYGHLSKFAQELQVGQRVEQGEIIGYVGATGLATGPHLDFSINKDGQRINFLELELPPASSVSLDYREDFDMVKENYLSILKENI